MKIAVVLLCFVAVAFAQNNHHCTSDSDCTCADNTLIPKCDASNHQCTCVHDNGHPVGKKQADQCQNNSECMAHCSPHIGDCINGKCHCHAQKRQADQCQNNSECMAHCSPHIGDCINGKCHCHQQ